MDSEMYREFSREIAEKGIFDVPGYLEVVGASNGRLSITELQEVRQIAYRGLVEALLDEADRAAGETNSLAVTNYLLKRVKDIALEGGIDKASIAGREAAIRARIL